MNRQLIPVLTRVLVFLLPFAGAHAANRTYDGTGNSAGNRGAAKRPFLRLAPAEYTDGLSTLAGPLRPNPRTISNLVSDQNVSEPNGRGGSDFIWQWGQFLDHDITLTPSNSGQSAPIAITDNTDVLYNAAFPFIPLTRSKFVVDASNVRQQVNVLTSFVDASNVYGSDTATAIALRELSGGRMKMEADGMLPFNTAGLPMGGIGLVPVNQLRMAGDVRANEQPGLAAVHTLFVREHNRLAAEIAAANPSWNDEQIYQRARKIVGAIIQSITYNEWLPALLGPHAPHPSTFTYKPEVDPTVSNEVATALFRFGHTMVSPQLMRIHDDNFPDDTPSIDLKAAFFNLEAINSSESLEYILKGLACQLHQDVDARIVPDLRNTLFGPAGSGGMDLAALNLQRGREHGLADYNTVRASYGLPPATTWSDISSDPLVQIDYEEIYDDTSDLDLWSTALSEDPLPGGAMGETITTALAAEFTRRAEGDAFFYLWDSDLSPALRTEITWTSLGNIIGRNTSLSPQYNVFFIPQSDLALQRIRHHQGTGMELNFMAEPGYAYQIVFGSRPDQMTGNLFGQPVSSGAATHMIQSFDIGALSAPKRFYKLVRSETAQ